MKSEFHSSSPYLPALTFFLPSFLQSSLSIGREEVDIDDSVTSEHTVLLILSTFTSYETVKPPLTD